MDRWNGKIAIVTGVSGGIGRSIVEKFVEQGLKVVGLARRKDRLDELAKQLSHSKGKFYPQQADISKEEDVLRVFKWTKENIGPVSILVNNAGIMKNVKLSDSLTENWRDIIDVNIIGLSMATREAVKQMKESKIDGHIIHINSIAGHKVTNFPGASMYQASKHAVSVLAETLRLELVTDGSKIKVTSLSPGIVKTELNDNSMSPEQLKWFNSLPHLNPSDIADAALYLLSTPAHVQTTGYTQLTGYKSIEILDNFTNIINERKMELTELSLNHEGSDYTVIVSLDVANVLLNDPQAAREFIEQNTNYAEQPVDSSSMEEENTENSDPGPKNKLVWTSKRPSVHDNEATEFFLKLRLEFADKFDDRRTVKGQIWQLISDKLNKAGFYVGEGRDCVEKCRVKFANLQKQYFNHIKHMNKTGESKKDEPPHFVLMHDILGKKDKTNPKNTQDSLNETISIKSDGEEETKVTKQEDTQDEPKTDEAHCSKTELINNRYPN